MREPVNFRDFGGITGLGGRRIARGRMYRGGQLYGLEDAEKQAFCARYGITDIIDLRNEESYLVEPNGEIPGVLQHSFQVMGDMEELSNRNPMRNSSAEAAEKYLSAVYAAFITNEHANRCFRAIAELFASRAEGGVYVHCFAGKDRTGIVAAILLGVLGASEEDILADYMLTAEGRRVENERLIEAVQKDGLTDGQIAAMRVFLGVKPEYLTGALRTANEVYGSFDAYLREGVGISEETIAALCERYLV